MLEEDAVWVSGLDGAPFAGGAHKVVEASVAGELPGNERFRLACLGGAVGGVADDWQAMRLLLRAVESLEDRGWLLLEEALSGAAGARSPQAQARLALSWACGRSRNCAWARRTTADASGCCNCSGRTWRLRACSATRA
ncbi:hypothetical protein ACP3P8_27240 [Pseudomonas aeruginosa]